ncbi:hypothetical protein EVAR_2763_1 [Eumeta japonica]|uniref:PWWP domain-containing protein n=1 Tax=Eumeta variegata TaxID=151549 RepID=A0A4C1SZL4_EUMVA|nr:hypothetical protein EVAR_2763_1 [Eumeta japonica]
MCEQTEIHYLDGEVVWVKLGSCWWPGEVFGFDKLPPGVLSSFRKPPIAVVKFFQEDKFEYVRNINSVYKYNCSRKNEFIRKGLDLYRSKHGPMEKFPEDVIRAEAATNGDVEILNRDEFQEIKKESYAGLFGDTSKKTPISAKKGKNTKMQHSISSTMKTSQMLRYNKSDGDYKVHILVQGTRSSTPSQTEDLDLTPSTSQMDFLETSDSSSNVVTPKPEQVTVSTSISNSRVYACHACPFTTTRMNIMVHHNKTHSATFIPYTPSPVRKKTIKTTPKSTKPKSSTFKTPKSRKTHKDKPKLNSSQALKRAAEEEIHDTDKKKIKTDEEIKSSLLADWEDMEDEESPEELLTVPTNTSEIPIPSESASVPATAESSVPELCSDTPLDENTKYGDNCSPTIEKPNSSSDSKYEFCEDEDWSLEADAGRKIPRVKNPSKKRTDVQSSSVEEDDVAREVAELLDKTAVPELPSVPESLKVEENFPELPIAKSPDKIPEKYPDNTLLATTPSDKNTLEVQQKKTIFKTKTFFRSRHSRSQDAIGKYVAEQLNAAERMDPAESEINGAESVPSPELRESPPVDHVRVARLAPKIQLKKMKAEAQLREKTSVDFNIEDGVLSFAVSQEVVDVEDGHISQDTCSKKESQNKVDDNNIGESKSIIDDFLNDENNCNQTNITSQKDANLETHLQVKSSDEQYKESESLEKNCLETEHTNTDANLFETRTSTNPHYMNETTASAVDALLSVSRETDRVTKIISNDLPEELFEDEQKDNLNANALNGLDDKNILTNGENSSSEHNIVEEIVENNHKEGSETVDSIEQLQSINKDDITNNPEIDEKETKNGLQNAIDGTPSESDLQIAEALINLPSTTLHSKSNEEISLDSKTEPEVSNVESIKEFTVDVNTTDCFISSNKNELQDENNKPVCEENVNNVAPEDVAMTTKQNDKDCNLEPLIQENKCESDMNNIHFESEQEKSDNLNAAQSLVQMSETLDHSTLNTDNCINNLNETPILSIEDDNETTLKTNNETDENPLKKETVTELKPQNDNDNIVSSKLLKILEETSTSKVERLSKISPQKQMIVQNKEKILNFNVCKSPLKNAPQSPKQKIIIRRTNSNKNMINALSDPSQDKIILSKSTKTSQDGSSVPTYTIQASPDVSCDSSTIVIQQKVRKLQNSSKAQKTKPQTSLVNISPNKILEKTDDTLFDISSMPIVLSEDLNPENLEKMPIVMTDGNMVSSTQNQSKPKQSVIAEKEIHSGIKVSNKTDIKTLIMNAVTENNRSTTPNIISKASKLKSGKPMIIIDKLTGKQRIILPKQEITPKEVKSNTPKSPISGQPNKSEKFIILPANSSPRSSRPQKIVIDPQSGKAHILIGKSEGTASAMLPAPVALTPSAIDSKPVSAKLIPAVADSSNAGGTVMIITDAQGTQSRILLTSEHEKLLFPNKQQTITQIKTVPQRQTIVSAGTIQKTQTVITTLPQTLPIKNQTRLVPKQRGAIITSKGQLIVGGRIATKTSQSVTTLPEIRPATSKRIISSNPTKVIQTVQKLIKWNL